MATVSSAALPLQRVSWLRPKYLLFAFIGLMLAYVLRHNEHFLIDAKDPKWAHIHPFRWYLLPHGIMGACALLLGPLQFSDRLRQRFAQFHRVVGRFYVAGVFIGAPMGLYIQYFEERMGGARSFSFAAGTDAALWMLTTAVAIVFLEVRVVGGLTGWKSESAIETTVWMCVAFSLLFADIVLQWRDFSPSRPSAAKVQPVQVAQI